MPKTLVIDGELHDIVSENETFNYFGLVALAVGSKQYSLSGRTMSQILDGENVIHSGRKFSCKIPLTTEKTTV